MKRLNALKFQMATSTLAIPLKMAMKNEAIAEITLLKDEVSRHPTSQQPTLRDIDSRVDSASNC